MTPSIHLAIADLHVGCQLGLCPPKGVRLDEGGTYKPSDFQRKLWRIWQRMWRRWVPEIVGSEAWDFILVGDAIEGKHHGATTQWSQNLKDQENAAYDILAPAVEMCRLSGGSYYHIRGTEAHSGISGEYEERLARRLGAVPNSAGQYARWELWKYIGPRKQHVVHYSHHIGTTSSTAYESTGLFREMVRAFTESARWDERVPDAIVRAHRHRHLEIPISGKWQGKRRRFLGIVLPGWQGKTPLVYRLPGGTQAPPQWGAVAICLTEEGELYTRDYVVSPEREEPE